MGLVGGGTPNGTITNRTTGTVAITYISAAENSTGQASHDFGGFTAGSSGLLVAFFGMAGSTNTGRTFSSVSIDGGAATGFLQLDTAAAGNGYCCGMAWKQVSSGSRNVTAVMSATNAGTPSAFCVCFLITGNVRDTPYWSFQAESGAATTSVFNYGKAPYSGQCFVGYKNGSDETISSFSSATADAADDEIGTTARHFRPAHLLNNTDVGGEATETITYSAGVGNQLAMGAGWV